VSAALRTLRSARVIVAVGVLVASTSIAAPAAQVVGAEPKIDASTVDRPGSGDEAAVTLGDLRAAELTAPAAPRSWARARRAPGSPPRGDGSPRAGDPQAASVAAVAAVTDDGLPRPALRAYRNAERVLGRVDPSCRLPWTLLAGIGAVESSHGQYAGAVVGRDGRSSPLIYGLPLDGSPGIASIADSDDGRLDRDEVWDRAVGPMQFIPTTWAVMGADGDRDGIRDPHDLDDAALAAGVYLCSSGGDLSTVAGARAAVYRYNHSYRYVDVVLSYAAAYVRGDYPTFAGAVPAGGEPGAQSGVQSPGGVAGGGQQPESGSEPGPSVLAAGPSTGTGPDHGDPPVADPPAADPPADPPVDPPAAVPPVHAPTGPSHDPADQPPTNLPANPPTHPPVEEPTEEPTEAPTETPPEEPDPAEEPSEEPTEEPTEQPEPSAVPVPGTGGQLVDVTGPAEPCDSVQEPGARVAQPARWCVGERGAGNLVGLPAEVDHDGDCTIEPMRDELVGLDLAEAWVEVRVRRVVADGDLVRLEVEAFQVLEPVACPDDEPAPDQDEEPAHP